MEKINKLLIIILVIWALLAFIFAFFDLSISIAVANVNPSEFTWASIGLLGDKTKEALFIVSIVIIIGTLIGHYLSKVTIKNAIEWQRIVIYFFLVIYIINFFSLITIIKKYEVAISDLFTVFFLLALLALTFNKNWIQFIPIAISIIILIYSLDAISNIINVLWDRVRFDDLSSDYSEYTPWYVLNTNEHGNTSFISTHTKIACLTFPILFITQYKNIKKPTKVIFSISIIGWALYVAIVRVFIGKHYASDVLFPIGFASIITILLYKYFMSDKFRSVFFKKELND